jgi:hypothetical protein
MLKKLAIAAAVSVAFATAAFAADTTTTTTTTTPAATTASAAAPAQKKAAAKKHHAKQQHHKNAVKHTGKTGTVQPASNGIPASGQQAVDNPMGKPNPAH